MLVQNMLNVCNKMGTWFNLQPHFSLKELKASTCIYCKIGTILKIIFLLLVHAISLKGRMLFWYRQSNLIMMVLEVFVFSFETSITIIILGISTYGKMKDWEKCLSFGAHTIFRKEYLRKQLIMFAVIQCLLMVLTGINGWIWTETLGFNVYKYYIIRDLERYHTHMLFFMYVSLVYHIKGEFAAVNELLVDMVNKMKIKETRPQSTEFIKLVHGSANDIRQISKVYRNMYDVMCSLNNIFGWQMLFLIGYASAAILNLLYTSVWLMEQNMCEDSSNDIGGPLLINAVVACSITVRK